jgi:iron complex transport system ATP-binding protein
MSAPLLEVRDAHVTLGGATILDGVSLTASPGELVAVVGPNGAGKSTLARVARGLQRPSQGIVRWDGTDIGDIGGRRLARLRAFVPQRARVPDGVLVRQAVEIGRAPHMSPLRGTRRHDLDAIDSAMRRAGVEHLADRRLTTLSGGELQRTQVAVGLAQEAPAMIADEPTSSLDLGAAATMARLLRSLADDGLAVVLVVHDLGLAAAVADRVLVLDRGRTAATGTPAEALTPERLADIWNVDATLDVAPSGHTGLRVAWLETQVR